ncbi:MAG TPA: carboxypeptidase-like regulatory domain-containing protein [Candidatus Acidoferrales bacterium]|nr:carboxypeptidase-like regulatory domain-containing protein [Candidatus Acidoferrales bacterium]
MKLFTSIGALGLLIAVLSGCSGGSSGSLPSTSVNTPTLAAAPGTKHTQDVGGGGPQLNVMLGDAAPVLGTLTPTAVNVGVDAVNVVYQGQVTNIATYSTPYVVNVMANGGQPSSIGIGQVYAGNYTAVQFVLDVASSNVVASGQTLPISYEAGAATQSTANAGSNTTTAGTSTSVTVTVPGAFMIGGTPAEAIQVDFNLFESLMLNSSGNGVIARPTFFGVSAANAAQIDGTVVNAAGQPVSGAVVVALKANGNVANTETTSASGTFNLHSINAGTYQLVIYNTYTTAVGQSITANGYDASGGASIQGPSVTVTAGQTAQAGSITD